MFWITREPSSGSSVQCLTKNYIASLDCAVHTLTTGKYAAVTRTTSISTDTIVYCNFSQALYRAP